MIDSLYLGTIHVKRKRETNGTLLLYVHTVVYGHKVCLIFLSAFFMQFCGTTGTKCFPVQNDVMQKLHRFRVRNVFEKLQIYA